MFHFLNLAGALLLDFLVRESLSLKLVSVISLSIWKKLNEPTGDVQLSGPYFYYRADLV